MVDPTRRKLLKTGAAAAALAATPPSLRAQQTGDDDGGRSADEPPAYLSTIHYFLLPYLEEETLYLKRSGWTLSQLARPQALLKLSNCTFPRKPVSANSSRVTA